MIGVSADEATVDPIRAIIVLSAMTLVVNTFHDPFVWLAALPLMAIVLAPGEKWRQPGYWFGAAGVYALVLALRWTHFEDHSFLMLYWLVAIGLSLGVRDYWDAIAFHARALVGLAFGLAAAWKLFTPDFVAGNTYHVLFNLDGRFGPIFNELLAGTTAPDHEANLDTLADLARSTGGVDPIELSMGSRVGFVSRAMAAWTILIEAVIAIAFLAPDRTAVAKLRHPALLTFCVSTYLLIPVLGFAMLLAAMGIAVARGDQRWLRAYIAMAALVPVRILLGVIF